MPKRLSHPSRKTIGLRVPDRKGTQLLLEQLGEPLIATTLIPPGETEPLNDADSVLERFPHEIDAVVDAGACPLAPTTVLDLTPMSANNPPIVLRQGQGRLDSLGLETG